MFLSLLLINAGNDPDRPQPGRTWLKNLYRVHQRLCMAFPSTSRKVDDPDFINPFKPEDFGQKQVHVDRREGSGFLFRIDPQLSDGVAILVQSGVKPDWDYAFHNAGYFLASPPEVRQLNTSFQKGQTLQFRLLANPTRKIDTKSGPDGLRRNGRRVPVPVGQVYEWLEQRAEPSGFSVKREFTTVQSGYSSFKKSPADGEQEARLHSVRYDGLLKVTEPASFKKTLISGIGPGKALGFGLLSIAPAPGVR